MSIPNSPVLIGGKVGFQGLDAFGSGGCPAPTITLTDTTTGETRTYKVLFDSLRGIRRIWLAESGVLKFTRNWQLRPVLLPAERYSDVVEACYDAADAWEQTHGRPAANPHGAKLVAAD